MIIILLSLGHIDILVIRLGWIKEANTFLALAYRSMYTNLFSGSSVNASMYLDSEAIKSCIKLETCESL